MSKKTILLITGTRAEYGLLKNPYRELLKSKKFQPEFLVTGSHTLKAFGSTIADIKRDGAKIRAVVKIGDKDDMLASFVKEVYGITAEFKRNLPAAIMVLGDRDEPFAATIVAGHLGVPVIHLHGGELTGPVVDEYIRHSITKFAHVHFTATEQSRRRVLQLGEEAWRVFNVGAVGLDGLETLSYTPKEDLAKKFGLKAEKPWIFVVQHPTPLEKLPFIKQIQPHFRALSKLSGYEKIVSYPNTDTGSAVFRAEIEKYGKKAGFHVFKNFPREEYLSFLRVSDLLTGNSSSGIIESSYFGLPTVNIGNRQRCRERGENVLDCGYGESEIANALTAALTPDFQKRSAKASSPYGRGGASQAIVQILEKTLLRPDLLNKIFVDL